MNLSGLIKVYSKNFGTMEIIKNTYKKSKVIIIPYFFILLTAIAFVLISFYVSNILYKICFLIVVIIAYGGSIVWASYLHKKMIEYNYKSYENFENHRLSEIDMFIKETIKINTVKQYEILDTIIKKEIDLLEEIKIFPMANTIRQLFIALFITGLLSYSLKEIVEGDSETGLYLLALYLMIFGNIIIIATLIYALKSFTKKHKLKQISKLISSLQLSLSKDENKIEKNKILKYQNMKNGMFHKGRKNR